MTNSDDAHDLLADSGAEATMRSTEEKMLDFAEDLGRLLGSAQQKASAWMDQRTSIVAQLTQVRDTADALIQQLTRGTGNEGAQGKGRPARSGADRSTAAVAAPTRPPGAGTPRAKAWGSSSRPANTTGAKRGRPKGFKMSDEARAKMRASWEQRRKQQGKT